MTASTITIEMAGAGGTMDFDIELLVRSLELIGYEVNVTTNYGRPRPWIEQKMERDEWFAKATENRRKFEEKYGTFIPTAQINVTDIPWGG